MPSEDPEILELVRALVREELATRFAPFPARIMSVSVTNQTIDVVPWRADIPPLLDVPVLVPGSQASAETIRLQNGDWVLVIPCAFSLDEFIGTDAAGPTMPRDRKRQQSIQDVFAIPMVRNPSPDAAARSADRAIEGSDVRLGDATSADPMLRGSSAFQSAWDAGWAAIDAALLLANAGGYLPAASTTFQAAKPALALTTNVKGS